MLLSFLYSLLEFILVLCGAYDKSLFSLSEWNFTLLSILLRPIIVDSERAKDLCPITHSNGQPNLHYSWSLLVCSTPYYFFEYMRAWFPGKKTNFIAWNLMNITKLTLSISSRNSFDSVLLSADLLIYLAILLKILCTYPCKYTYMCDLAALCNF